ncbi:MAG: GNAT family N-acetyltransferase [Bacillota bacterium]
MEIKIRKEENRDHERVRLITELAFRNEPFSQQNEAGLIEALRKRSSFIPELSLVAEADGVVAGHSLFTPLTISNQADSYSSLALAPVSVHPEFQRKGIGKKLIAEGICLARGLGYGSVLVLGNPEYYKNFGFKPAIDWNIIPKFMVPCEYFMALELSDGALSDVSGYVDYPEEFDMV